MPNTQIIFAIAHMDEFRKHICCLIMSHDDRQAGGVRSFFLGAYLYLPPRREPKEIDGVSFAMQIFPAKEC